MINERTKTRDYLAEILHAVPGTQTFHMRYQVHSSTARRWLESEPRGRRVAAPRPVASRGTRHCGRLPHDRLQSHQIFRRKRNIPAGMQMPRNK